MVIRVPALIQPVDPRVSSQRPTGCWSASYSYDWHVWTALLQSTVLHVITGEVEHIKNIVHKIDVNAVDGAV